MLESLNKQAEIDIKNLIAETGHIMNVNDLPLLFKLNKLADRITNLSEPHNKTILNMPVNVGGRWLFHPVIAQLMWLEHHSEWLNNLVLYSVACAFVCDVKNDFDATRELLDFKEAKKAVVKYGFKLRCNMMELSLAVKSLLLVSEDAGAKDSGSEGYWNIISYLSREYGSKPSYWRNEADIGMIISLMDESAKAAKEMLKKADKRAVDSFGANKADMLVAVKKYRDFLNDLKGTWTNDKQN